MKNLQRPLPWLDVGEKFPPVNHAWGADDPAPGLLAAGAALDVATLMQAYKNGIFPWFSEGQPILWWSPDPRMVLHTKALKLHRSLRQRLQKFLNSPVCEIRFDTRFAAVIKACADKPRDGQPGTWILPEMIAGYSALHDAGHAHSIETWIAGELVGGLYCVNLGGMVFGESMFAHVTDASKIALCALVAFCRANGIAMIDCQQSTKHLASLGAEVISRSAFMRHVANAIAGPKPMWQFQPLYWNHVLPNKTPTTQ